MKFDKHVIAEIICSQSFLLEITMKKNTIPDWEKYRKFQRLDGKLKRKNRPKALEEEERRNLRKKINK